MTNIYNSIKMKAEEKLLCDFMANFFKDNFDKITYDLSDSRLPTQKDQFVKEVLTNPETAIWSLLELASWGMDKEYLEELRIEVPEDCLFTILRIQDKYLKVTIDDKWQYEISFSEPKTKTVIYFD